MKTKNIFRMLLMAVVLLMGANNVMADEIEIWSGNVSPGYWPPTFISIEGQFSGAQSEYILRLEGTSGGYAQAKLAVADSDGGSTTDIMGDYIKQPDFNEAGYFDITLTQEQADALKSHSYLAVFADQFTLTRIVLISGNSTDPGSDTGTDPVEPTSYTITISSTTNGTVAASAESATEGTEITLTVTPDEGYELDELTVNNGDVTVTDNKFTMPASDVTVTATFKQTTTEPVGPTIPDVENETILWTGSESAEGSDGHVYNLTADLFTNIKAGDTFRVYVSDINTNQNWKLYITNDVNGWGTQVFEDWDGGDILKDNTGSSHYHAEDGYGYFEFTCSETSATNFKTNGTQMSFQYMTVVKVSYISNETEEPITYAITVSPTTNGTITASAERAAAGTEVTLTITPAEGYELDALTVKAGDTDVTVTDNKFTMPVGDVTVTATFKQTATEPVQVTYYGTESNGTWTFDFNTIAATVSGNTILSLTDAGATIGGISMATASWDNGSKALNSKIVLGNNEKQWRLIPGTNGGSLNANNSSCLLGIQNVTAGQIIKITLTVGGDGAKTYPTANSNVELTTDPSGDGTYIFTVQANGDAGIMLGNKTFISSITIEPAQDTPVETEYSVTLNYNANQGSVTMEKQTGKADDTMWVYVSPNDGYAVSSVTTNPATAVEHYGDYNGYDAYYFNMPEGNVIVNVSFESTAPAVEYEEATIGSTGYATFSSSNALDFTGLSGIKAYVVTEVDGNYAYLEQVTGTVAAETGMLIVGSTTSVPIADSGTSYSNNLLQAVLGSSQSVSGSGKYVLTTYGTGVRFAETAHQSATVDPGHAYLDASASGARIQFINIVWDNDVTAIDAAKAAIEGDTVIYNLQGQRVVNPTKGVYIINGKKVAIK